MKLCVLAAILWCASGAGIPKLFLSKCFENDKITRDDWETDVFQSANVATMSLTVPVSSIRDLFNQTDHSIEYDYLDTTLIYSVPESDATFKFNHVGLKLRGLATRANAFSMGTRFSLSLRFNDREFFGIHKVALRSEIFDPTYLREFLALDLFYAMGVCTVRKALVALNVNNEYWGVYVMSDVVHDFFLKDAFSTSTGGYLYKPQYFNTMYEGYPMPLRFTQASSILRTNMETGDYAHLNNLVGFIHRHSNDSFFAEELENMFDVDMFLRAMAVEVAISGFDNFWSRANNYFLLFDVDSEIMRYIPFDFDRSFGIYYEHLNSTFHFNTKLDSVYSPNLFFGPIQLVESVIRVPKFRERYTAYLSKLLDTYFVPKSSLLKRFKQLHALLNPWAGIQFLHQEKWLFPNSSFFHLSVTKNITLCRPIKFHAQGLPDIVNATECYYIPPLPTWVIERRDVLSPQLDTQGNIASVVQHQRVLPTMGQILALARYLYEGTGSKLNIKKKRGSLPLEKQEKFMHKQLNRKPHPQMGPGRILQLSEIAKFDFSILVNFPEPGLEIHLMLNGVAYLTRMKKALEHSVEHHIKLPFDTVCTNDTADPAPIGMGKNIVWRYYYVLKFGDNVTSTSNTYPEDVNKFWFTFVRPGCSLRKMLEERESNNILVDDRVDMSEYKVTSPIPSTGKSFAGMVAILAFLSMVTLYTFISSYKVYRNRKAFDPI